MAWNNFMSTQGYMGEIYFTFHIRVKRSCRRLCRLPWHFSVGHIALGNRAFNLPFLCRLRHFAREREEEFAYKLYSNHRLLLISRHTGTAFRKKGRTRDREMEGRREKSEKGPVNPCRKWKGKKLSNYKMYFVLCARRQSLIRMC